MKTKSLRSRNWLNKILASILLLTMPLSMAQALEMQIFSNEQREENANILILDNDNTEGDVILQFGGSLGKQLYWDATSETFVFNDSLKIDGSLELKLGTAVDTILDDDTMASNSATALATQQSIKAYVDGQISSTGHAQNTDTGTTSASFIINNGGTDGSLQFGQVVGGLLSYNDASGLFTFNDSVHIEGDITLSGTVNGIDVAGLDATVSGQGNAIGDRTYTEQNFIINEETITDSLDGLDVQVQNNVDNITTNASSISTLNTTVSGQSIAIGNRTYTEENFITDGEDITTSLNVLDMQVQDNVDNISANSSAIGSNTSGISSLEGRATALEGRADGHDTAILANSDAISALETASTSTTPRTIAISMNDLTIASQSTANKADVHTGMDSNHQYYVVKTKQPTMQDLTLQFKVKLPEDFDSFGTIADALSFNYKTATNSDSDNKIVLTINDEANSVGYSSSNLTSNIWTNLAATINGATFNPVAGDYIYITATGYATSGYSPFIGEIVLKYNANKLK